MTISTTQQAMYQRLLVSRVHSVSLYGQRPMLSKSSANCGQLISTYEECLLLTVFKLVCSTSLAFILCWLKGNKLR